MNLWKSVLEDYNLTRPEDEPIFRQLYLNSAYQPNQVHIISHPEGTAGLARPLIHPTGKPAPGYLKLLGDNPSNQLKEDSNM